MGEYGPALAPPHWPKEVPPWAMYRLKDTFRSIMSLRLPIKEAMERVSWGLPQWSNQPVQYSLHIRGALGFCSLNALNWLSILEPAPKFSVVATPSKAYRLKLEDQSQRNSCTLSKPASLTASRMSAM